VLVTNAGALLRLEHQRQEELVEEGGAGLAALLARLQRAQVAEERRARTRVLLARLALAAGHIGETELQAGGELSGGAADQLLAHVLREVGEEVADVFGDGAADGGRVQAARVASVQVGVEVEEAGEFGRVRTQVAFDGGLVRVVWVGWQWGQGRVQRWVVAIFRKNQLPTCCCLIIYCEYKFFQ